MVRSDESCRWGCSVRPGENLARRHTSEYVYLRGLGIIDSRLRLLVLSMIRVLFLCRSGLAHGEMQIGHDGLVFYFFLVQRWTGKVAHMHVEAEWLGAKSFQRTEPTGCSDYGARGTLYVHTDMGSGVGRWEFCIFSLVR